MVRYHYRSEKSEFLLQLLYCRYNKINLHVYFIHPRQGVCISNQKLIYLKEKIKPKTYVL